MALGSDILDCLDSDTCLKIFLLLDDPADLIRLSCVSRSWRQFVIGNCLCKILCCKYFPPSHRFDCVVETINCPQVKSFASFELDGLEKEHRAYAFLYRGCVAFHVRGLIEDAISASSTDNYPDETVRNTLDQGHMAYSRPSYWSSKGQSDPSVPEILIYKLVSKICVISEVSVHPFQAYFQWGSPIYSAKAVRFRMGHSKNLYTNEDPSCGLSENLTDDNFVWTYTSPVYPMAQENTLQRFKLPEPVLCLGGHMQVELLGRVQRQEMDGLFYICVCHVEAVGRSLSPAFDMDMEPSGRIVLKAQSYCHPPPPPLRPPPSPPSPHDVVRHGPDRRVMRNVRHLEIIMDMLRGGEEAHGFLWVNGEDEFNDEFE